MSYSSGFRYSVGDRVIVRSDLKEGTYYMRSGSSSRPIADYVIDNMLALAGSIVTIKSVNRNNSGKYRIEEFDCNWTDEMFAGKFADPTEDDGIEYDVTRISKFIHMCGGVS